MSMRKSVLVILTGILLGWAAAFVVVYQLIRSSVAPPPTNPSITVQAPVDRLPGDAELDRVEPAAGPPPR